MTAVRPNEGVDPIAFANSVRALLDEDWRRYRNFGPYWYLVKALLKRVFDRHQMPMLGDFEDPGVIARMPAGLSMAELLGRAVEEYQTNASFNLGRSRVEDDDGEVFLLLDPDMEGG